MGLITVQTLQTLGTILSETKFIYKTYSSSTFEYDWRSHFLSCCKILYKHMTVSSLYHYISVLLVNHSAEELHCLVEELLFVISVLHFIFAVFILWNLLAGICSNHFIKAKRPWFTVILEQLSALCLKPTHSCKPWLLTDYCFI